MLFGFTGLPRYCPYGVLSARKIEEHFGDGSKWGVNIEYLVENTPLGNAGALFKLNLKEDFLLLNADAMFDVDFNRFVASTKSMAGWSRSSRTQTAIRMIAAYLSPIKWCS